MNRRSAIFGGLSAATVSTRRVTAAQDAQQDMPVSWQVAEWGGKVEVLGTFVSSAMIGLVRLGETPESARDGAWSREVAQVVGPMVMAWDIAEDIVAPDPVEELQATLLTALDACRSAGQDFLAVAGAPDPDAWTAAMAAMERAAWAMAGFHETLDAADVPQ